MVEKDAKFTLNVMNTVKIVILVVVVCVAICTIVYVFVNQPFTIVSVQKPDFVVEDYSYTTGDYDYYPYSTMTVHAQVYVVNNGGEGYGTIKCSWTNEFGYWESERNLYLRPGEQKVVTFDFTDQRSVTGFVRAW